MKILVGCERSGIVRDAFKALGHYAWSCDLEPTDTEGNHYRCDVFDAINDSMMDWDLIILHPPCTHLAVSGNRWYAGSEERFTAIEWTVDLFNAACAVSDRVALENPVGALSTAWRKPDQYIQPWEYGHGETKKTGLWLHNLPKLTPTDIVDGRENRIWKMPPSADRGRIRSETYVGIANAMAEQWGQEGLIEQAQKST